MHTPGRILGLLSSRRLVWVVCSWSWTSRPLSLSSPFLSPVPPLDHGGTAALACRSPPSAAAYSHPPPSRRALADAEAGSALRSQPPAHRHHGRCCRCSRGPPCLCCGHDGGRRPRRLVGGSQRRGRDGGRASAGSRQRGGPWRRWGGAWARPEGALLPRLPAHHDHCRCRQRPRRRCGRARLMCGGSDGGRRPRRGTETRPRAGRGPDEEQGAGSASCSPPPCPYPQASPRAGNDRSPTAPGLLRRRVAEIEIFLSSAVPMRAGRQQRCPRRASVAQAVAVTPTPLSNAAISFR